MLVDINDRTHQQVANCLMSQVTKINGLTLDEAREVIFYLISGERVNENTLRDAMHEAYETVQNRNAGKSAL